MIKLKKTGLRVRRKSFEEDDDLGFAPISNHNIIVIESEEREPEFTGLLDQHGRPLFKTFMKKLEGIGFTAVWDDQDYDPDGYYYNTRAGYSVSDEIEEDEEAGDGA